jgi:hypothetical protein
MERRGWKEDHLCTSARHRGFARSVLVHSVEGGVRVVNGWMSTEGGGCRWNRLEREQKREAG